MHLLSLVSLRIFDLDSGTSPKITKASFIEVALPTIQMPGSFSLEREKIRLFLHPITAVSVKLHSDHRCRSRPLSTQEAASSTLQVICSHLNMNFSGFKCWHTHTKVFKCLRGVGWVTPMNAKEFKYVQMMADFMTGACPCWF